MRTLLFSIAGTIILSGCDSRENDNSAFLSQVAVTATAQSHQPTVTKRPPTPEEAEWYKSQGIDPNGITVSIPRPLTKREADEVRSHNLDPTGMMIDAGLPIIRELTPDELASLDSKGIDSSQYKGKAVTLETDQEMAAMERLIKQAENTKAVATPSDLKNAIIWLDTFMGITNTNIMADVISTKTESIKFYLAGQTYDYSGHYTIMLNTPRKHSNPYFGLGSAPTASLVMLEGVGGDSMPLTNATIWDRGNGFIILTALGKEWIHSGLYTIQK